MEKIDKKKVEKEAKEILDKFAKALGRVGEKDKQFFVDREEFEREESGGEGVCDESFKERLLDNAPRKNSDFVIAEKGEWKK
jgi:predicted Asp-tRNA(Asn)/Glu-tRNA(Gln) amidotransferase subunit C